MRWKAKVHKTDRVCSGFLALLVVCVGCGLIVLTHSLTHCVSPPRVRYAQS